jgi:hypothetical protein
VLDYLSTREHEDLPERDPLLDPLATDTIEIDAPNPLLESREEWLRRGTRQLEGAWLEATQLPVHEARGRPAVWVLRPQPWE